MVTTACGLCGGIYGNDDHDEVDAHSERMEAMIMPTITARVTLEMMHDLFAIHMLLETIVSGNCPAFASNSLVMKGRATESFIYAQHRITLHRTGWRDSDAR